MALALAMCNVERGQAVKVPAMTGSQLHLLMMWLGLYRNDTRGRDAPFVFMVLGAFVA